MKPVDWDQRYNQQAGWTAQLREYLFDQVGLPPGSRVLEPGSGTGAVLNTLSSRGFNLHGIDLQLDPLVFNSQQSPRACLACADAAKLPFPAFSFDAVYCHFFLLWVDPGLVLAEIRRVLRSGGWMLALAEPDYESRIDYPDSLAELGRLQIESLRAQGADPSIGRRLAGLFTQAGFVDIQVGIMGANWEGKSIQAGNELEWEVLRDDLAGYGIEEELDRYKKIDKAARQAGSRILFVPTFYAIGKAP